MPRAPFSLLALVLGLAFLAWAFSLAGTVGAPSGTVNYTTFLEDLKAGRVKEVVVRAGDTRIQGVLEDGSAFTTYAASPLDNATLEGWMAREVKAYRRHCPRVAFRACPYDPRRGLWRQRR